MVAVFVPKSCLEAEHTGMATGISQDQREVQGSQRLIPHRKNFHVDSDREYSTTANEKRLAASQECGVEGCVPGVGCWS